MVQEPRITPFSDFVDIHQVNTIPIGETRTIFFFQVPESCRAFIDKIGNTDFVGARHEFKIDGQIVETQIAREVGLVNKPAIIDPPYYVRSTIEWITQNSGTALMTQEVLIDGLLYHHAEWKALQKISPTGY